MINAIQIGFALAMAMLAACAAEKATSVSPIVVRGQLISEATKKPLSGYLVDVGDARPKNSPFGIRGADKFGSGRTEVDGTFVVTINDVLGYREAEKGGTLALYLSGVGAAADRQPIVGIIGFKAGVSPGLPGAVPSRDLVAHMAVAKGVWHAKHSEGVS